MLEEAELDEEQEKKLEREFAREYHLITRDDRLETVAEDLVAHFVGRGFQGKAMVVSHRQGDRGAHVRQGADAVGGARSTELRASCGERLDGAAQRSGSEERASPCMDGDRHGGGRLARRRTRSRRCRRRGSTSGRTASGWWTRTWTSKFKDPDDPLRLVFVCAMWMTGFDVPSCSTIYLDKPMRNHTLMQTIARANRVFPDKDNGLIVDYVGVFRDLQKALAIYGAGKEATGRSRTRPQLVAALRQAVHAATAFCASHGVDLVALEALPLGGLERLAAVENAINALIAPDAVRRDFFGHEQLVGTLYRAVKPDPVALEFAQR